MAGIFHSVAADLPRQGVLSSGGRVAAPLTKSPGRILIVDDDVDGVDALKYLLESEGYVVDSASNGREGLQHLHDGPKPCVVILDLAMPVMTGWQFLAARDGDASLSKIPVIVLT